MSKFFEKNLKYIVILAIVVGIIYNIYKNLDLPSKTITSPKSPEFTILSTDKSPSNDEIIGNMYRNQKYNFRIKFPEGWDIKTGDGKHIVKKAVKNGSTISILVYDYEGIPADMSLSDLDEGGDALLQSFIDDAKNSFIKFNVIESSKTFISNRPAYYLKLDGTYRVLDKEIEFTNVFYYVLFDGNIYMISAGSLKSDFYLLEPIFKKSIGSMVFEKY